MKATLITYSAKKLNKSEASKLSKALIGYLDKSNKAKYTYKRQGLIEPHKGIVVSRSTFIVKKPDDKKIIDFILAKNAKVSFWNIEIPNNYFNN